MGFNLGIRWSPKRGPRITKSYSAGPMLFWQRKGKIDASVRLGWFDKKLNNQRKG